MLVVNSVVNSVVVSSPWVVLVHGWSIRNVVKKLQGVLEKEAKINYFIKSEIQFNFGTFL